MELDLTKKSGTRRITDLAVSWSWSGDKSTSVRQLKLEMIFDETAGLPIPEIGDIITFSDDAGTRLFVVIVGDVRSGCRVFCGRGLPCGCSVPQRGGALFLSAALGGKWKKFYLCLDLCEKLGLNDSPALKSFRDARQGHME